MISCDAHSGNSSQWCIHASACELRQYSSVVILAVQYPHGHFSCYRCGLSSISREGVPVPCRWEDIVGPNLLLTSNCGLSSTSTRHSRHQTSPMLLRRYHECAEKSGKIGQRPCRGLRSYGWRTDNRLRIGSIRRRFNKQHAQELQHFLTPLLRLHLAAQTLLHLFEGTDTSGPPGGGWRIAVCSCGAAPHRSYYTETHQTSSSLVKTGLFCLPLSSIFLRAHGSRSTTIATTLGRCPQIAREGFELAGPADLCAKQIPHHVFQDPNCCIL